MLISFKGLLGSLSALNIDGIIIYSLFMLPADGGVRNKIINKFLKSGKQVHAAAEDIIIKSLGDCERLNTIFLINNALEAMSYKETLNGTIKFYAGNS